MKKSIRITLIFILVIFCTFFGVKSNNLTLSALENLPSGKDFSYYKYEGEVPHFFTHQIINDAKKAFKSKLARHYDKDCITCTEFKNFLQEMYNNNYCLVDIYDVVGVLDGKAYFKDLFVPLGKKPFILSFDDMSYDSIGLGLSDKIILDYDGNIASYTRSNNPKIEYDKEAICIMESFIKEHEDFSCRNARAIICPTGYDGILGYRINKDGINREREIEEIRPLIEKLKNLNYHFGCHTYGHIQIAYSNYSTILRDLERYKSEILSVIGDTNIFCFPAGSKVSSGCKLELLKEYNYKIFFCVGDAKTCINNNVAFLKREVLNGVALRNFRNDYLKYFDTKKVYDHEHRTIQFPS